MADLGGKNEDSDDYWTADYSIVASAAVLVGVIQATVGIYSAHRLHPNWFRVSNQGLGHNLVADIDRR